MLTVDFNRLGLEPGDLILDMGCGAGRHAFEALRRDARVIALDYDIDELFGVRDLFWAMKDAGEASAATQPVRGDALHLPFADDTFDHIVCSEVLEHIGDDLGAIGELVRVLKPGGTMAVTVPAWFAEKMCWMLSAEYHAPLAEGGHVRIYTESQIRRRLDDAGMDDLGSHRAHALHSPYWWLKCAVGPTNDTHPAVRAYHRLLVWDISSAPPVTRLTERALNPLIGKSVVLYAGKPAGKEHHVAA